MWLGHKYVPVTLLSVVPQLIVRYKTLEKDGYDAVVIGAEKKILEKEKGIKEKYGMMMEVSIDSSYKESHEVGKILDASEFADVQEVTIQSVSKGK
jgi:ribosomal protein L3